MDAIFGRNQFRNDVIWCYGSPGSPKRHFPRKYDNILFYAKGDNFFDCKDILIKHKRIDKKMKKFGHKGELAKHTPKEVLEDGKMPFDWWTGIAPAYKIHTMNIQAGLLRSHWLCTNDLFWLLQTKATWFLIRFAVAPRRV